MELGCLRVMLCAAPPEGQNKDNTTKPAHSHSLPIDVYAPKVGGTNNYPKAIAMTGLREMTSALSLAVKQVPAMRFAVAAVGVAAAVGIIALFTSGVANPPVAIGLVVALMIVLVIFSVVARQAANLARAPAQFLIWAVSILFVLGVFSVLTSVWFGWPPGLARMIEPARATVGPDPIPFAQRSPELLFPEEGFAFDHSPRTIEMKWASMPGAASYVVDVQRWAADDSQWLMHPPQLKPSGTRADVILSGDERWRWRVSARDESGGASKPSAWRGFLFPDIPPPNSQSEPLMLHDGEVLLIRGTSHRGRAAIELTHGPGCKATYNWRFRRSSEEPELTGSGRVYDQLVSGDGDSELHVYGDNIIEAGPFHIRWGCASAGVGYIYQSSTFDVVTTARASLAEISL